MSNSYDNYGYDYSRTEKSASMKRRIIILVLIVLAIVLLLVLLKGCNGRNEDNNRKTDSKFDFESALIAGGKRYFESNSLNYPKAVGECEEIELQALVDRNLVNSKDFETCNLSATYVSVCRLENQTLHYYPWLVCAGTNSNEKYGNLKVGTLSDIVKDQTIVNFKFLPQVLNAAVEKLGKEEEVWKDEIKYPSYKTLATTTYYRYRDELFKWNVKDKKYYTSKGEKTNANDVNEYYVTSPNSSYTEKDNGTYAYKWFTSESKKVYAVDRNGTKVYSHTAISGYPYNEGGVCVEYQTREVTGTAAPKHYYVCAKSKNSTVKTYQLYKCGTGANAELVYELDNFWTCGSGTEQDILDGKVSSQSATCKTYSNWKNSEKSCDTRLDTCKKINPYCVYTWYKLEENGSKKYYPSLSSSASSETIYYTNAPVSGAIKDESTKTYAYKWYNSTTRLSDYAAVAPSSDAIKTSDSKWSDWTSYSTKNPKTNDGRNREIETRVKIKLQEILGMTEESWKDLTTNYMTSEEMIKVLKDKNYKVETLEDIQNNGELKYKVQMSIRNKKESK